jgi:hypothetical protein
MIKTFAVIETAPTKELRTALGYAAVPGWQADGKLYALNCSLKDAAIFCKNARKDTFLWGIMGGQTHHYRQKNGNPQQLSAVADFLLPDDAATHAQPIPDEALRDDLTFLGRAIRRRNAAMK